MTEQDDTEPDYARNLDSIAEPLLKIEVLQLACRSYHELLKRYAAAHRCTHRPLCLTAREADDAGANVL